MVTTRSSDLELPLLGKPRDQLPSLKLPMNLEVMLRFLYFFKCENLRSKKQLIVHVKKSYSCGKRLPMARPPATLVMNVM